MNVAYYLYSKIYLVYQNQEKIYFQMFVIHLNGMTLKTLLIQTLGTNIMFSRKLGGMHFFPSTCGRNMSLYGHILLPKQ